MKFRSGKNIPSMSSLEKYENVLMLQSISISMFILYMIFPRLNRHFQENEQKIRKSPVISKNVEPGGHKSSSLSKDYKQTHLRPSNLHDGNNGRKLEANSGNVILPTNIITAVHCPKQTSPSPNLEEPQESKGNGINIHGTRL